MFFFECHRSQGGIDVFHYNVKQSLEIFSHGKIAGSRMSNRVKAQNPVSWRRVIYLWASAFCTCWLSK